MAKRPDLTRCAYCDASIAGDYALDAELHDPWCPHGKALRMLADSKKSAAMHDRARLDIAERLSIAESKLQETTKHLVEMSDSYLAAIEREKSISLRLSSCEKERDEADRRAGAADRRCEDFVETVAKRNDWLHKAKADWGVDDRVSFDEVWKEALTLRSRLNERDQLLRRLFNWHVQVEGGGFVPLDLGRDLENWAAGIKTARSVSQHADDAQDLCNCGAGTGELHGAACATLSKLAELGLLAPVVEIPGQNGG